MNFVLSFLLLFFAFCLVFPTITFFADYMEATQWDRRAVISYIGFSVCGASMAALLAAAVFSMVVP